ncbi:glycosyltransferase [Leptospira gomenensis]|uniref:Glycosyltransferase n=1 Tax=Leptospira gomenensis TaxID=2484974 RepID=A0A5F1Y7G5_9LEPT|nr:glycosyltransferase family 4 protein [Leptospira gomenensis]TGK28156.1 glycosyltransferase [Leptospira gomenensis]TGK36990.1 glycosyltransferase [Leptospira gomenensis]TGK45626.1 glycosyltransferase [Leptospira gomenensis]TGK59565.1 glycosyltransferase [Leptospira gomenensis]
MKASLKKIAVVSPIFSDKVSGGSEKLIYQFVELLSEDFEVTVLTTRSLDYVTWKNSISVSENDLYQEWSGRSKPIRFEERRSSSGGKYKLFQFTVEKQRNIDRFNRMSEKILREPSLQNRENVNLWLEEQGPYVPELVQFIEAHKSEYEIFLFVSYLYYPLVFGIGSVIEKSIVTPTFHDEAPAYLPIYKEVLTDQSSYSFNTPEELSVFENILGYKPSSYSIVGMNLDLEKTDREYENRKKRKSGHDPISKENPFLLYIGRVDQGKGFLEMAEWFLEWKKKSGSSFKLKIVGKTASKIPAKILENDDIEFLGFVEETTKLDLLYECSCLVNSSPMESFSIVLMEAWLMEKPVLVNGKSDVLKGHCLRSNGGLFYSDRKSFFATLGYILDHPEDAVAMGKNGKEYVRLNFNPRTVREKLLRLIEKTIQKKYVGS